jgi:hypothetical protein
VARPHVQVANTTLWLGTQPAAGPIFTRCNPAVWTAHLQGHTPCLPPRCMAPAPPAWLPTSSSTTCAAQERLTISYASGKESQTTHTPAQLAVCL